MLFDKKGHMDLLRWQFTVPTKQYLCRTAIEISAFKTDCFKTAAGFGYYLITFWKYRNSVVRYPFSNKANECKFPFLFPNLTTSLTEIRCVKKRRYTICLFLYFSFKYSSALEITHFTSRCWQSKYLEKTIFATFYCRISTGEIKQVNTAVGCSDYSVALKYAIYQIPCLSWCRDSIAYGAQLCRAAIELLSEEDCNT